MKIIIKPILYGFGALIFFLLSFQAPTHAQLTRLNVGYSALSADQLPAWIAKDSGIFAQNGLDVQTIFFTGGSTAILALVSGDVPITQVAGPGAVSMMTGSVPATAVMTTRARGFMPCALAYSGEAISTAAAPSTTPEELPA